MRNYLSYFLMAVSCVASCLLPLGVLLAVLFQMLEWFAAGTTADIMLFITSIAPVLLTSFHVVLLALVIALPLGIASAIFIVFYAGERLAGYLSGFNRVLGIVPSILYGITGFYVFSRTLGLGQSIFTGSLTMALFVLPLIVSGTVVALEDASASHVEAAGALGVGKSRILYYLVLPEAIPSILASIFRSLARISGAVAPLILTAGVALNPPASILGSGRTIGVHLYYIAQEAITRDEFGQAAATAGLLMIFCLILTSLAAQIEKKIRRAT